MLAIVVATEHVAAHQAGIVASMVVASEKVEVSVAD